MKVLLSLAVIVSVVVVACSFAAAASPAAAPVPAAAAIPSWPYELHGNATSGWGVSDSSTSKPGPVLTVTTGDTLALELESADGQTHNWFLDLNNDSSLQSSEPHSPDVTSAGPIWYNYTVTQSPGTYTYRCAYHPSIMWGELVVQAKPTFVLWGSAGTSVLASGWGLTNDTLSYPGPTLNVTYQQTVVVDLFSADGADHSFYVDFAASASSAGNNVSVSFNGSHSIRYTFVASRVGDFQYACGIHGAGTMMGLLHVSSVPPPPAPDYTLYAAIIVVIAIVAIAVVVVIRRKPRTPPAQPPTPPPQ